MLLYYSSLNSWSLCFFMGRDVLCWCRTDLLFVDSWSSSNKIHKIKKKKDHSSSGSPPSFSFTTTQTKVKSVVGSLSSSSVMVLVGSLGSPVQQRCGQGGSKVVVILLEEEGSPCISMAARDGGWQTQETRGFGWRGRWCHAHAHRTTLRYETPPARLTDLTNAQKHTQSAVHDSNLHSGHAFCG